MTHYLKPMNFTDDTIMQAQKFVNKFINASKSAEELFGDVTEATTGSHLNEFVEKLEDDLNTPNAMAVLLAANKEFNKIIRTDKKEDAKIV
jgi:cysteinyl-tRNA synthetase